MRLTVALLVLVGIALAALRIDTPGRGAPLWPGSRFSRADRDRAVQRGLNFMYQIACNREDFRQYGHDLLSAFYNIAYTSSDPELRAKAWRMGHERALAFRSMHPSVPADVDSSDLMDLAFGDDAAARLGAPDPRVHTALRESAKRFSVYDYLLFDPAKEPPPADIPKSCRKCGHMNPRGSTVCSRCGQKLELYDPYDLYQDALIDTYTGDRMGITFGAHYADVLRWLPAMRPYPQRILHHEDHYYSGVYTITHVVYTYNDYSQNRLSPDCFPLEVAHLKANLTEAVRDKDPETMGEYLDSLRSFGMNFNDELIRAGFDYLLSVQNTDGSWGDTKDPDPYGRYHPTWTAVDGLRDYRWKRILPCPSF